MSDTPKISICIPMYNKAAHIERCLGTVLATDPGSLEIVVFDNGSTDGSTQIVARLAAADARVRHIRLEHTIMIQESWRMALLHGRGEFLKLQSADDELHPDFWRHMLPPLEQSADTDFTLCGERLDISSGSVADAEGMTRYYEGLNANCRQLLAMPDSAERIRQLALGTGSKNGLGNIYKVLFRRRCLPLERWRAVTGAYPMPTSYPDWDFLLRLFLNHRGHYVDQALSTYSIAPDAPIARLRHDPALTVANWHQLLLMVLTSLADPTLQRLRAALTQQEIQALHDEAVRRMTRTVQLTLAMPRPTA